MCGAGEGDNAASTGRHWPDDLFVVPEYAFGLFVSDGTVPLSDEHIEVAWLPFCESHERLTWDSNKVALWELEQRLRNGLARRDTPSSAY